jgi:hypothetical protein
MKLKRRQGITSTGSGPNLLSLRKTDNIMPNACFPLSPAMFPFPLVQYVGLDGEVPTTSVCLVAGEIRVYRIQCLRLRLTT